MRNLTIYVTLALLCTIAFTGQSADIPDKQKPKFRVEVSVTCDDENTKAFIESHIKRELRSLQDVEIIGLAVSGDYKLHIVAIELTSLRRKTGDVAVSYLFAKTFDPTPIEDKSKKWTKDNQEAQLEIVDLMWLHEDFVHGLRVGMTDNLDKICKQIIVDFDTVMLEPKRKTK